MLIGRLEDKNNEERASERKLVQEFGTTKQLNSTEGVRAWSKTFSQLRSVVE